jgi:hypothetical protein
MGVLASRARFITESFFFVFQLYFSPLFNKDSSSLEKSISVLLMNLG